MGRRADPADADRYLVERDGHWHYKRKVPGNAAEFDTRAPVVRMSLKTTDLAAARRKRDALEAADNELWASYLVGGDAEVSLRRYRSAVRRVEAMGFGYQPVEVIAAQGGALDAIEQLRPRFAVADRAAPHDQLAALGLVDAPSINVTEAFRVYREEIMPALIVGKSKPQRESFEKVKTRAVENFKRVVGDVAFSDITRDQALQFYQHWMGRVAPKGVGAKPSASFSTGNRDVGNMRKLFAEYHLYIGDRDKPNPFDDLNFAGKKKSRPPFSMEWLQKRILVPEAMQRLNLEARGAFLAVLGTGARPSEICNLLPEEIVLDAPVPYIHIRPHEGDSPREIKTSFSERQVPLVGLALDVFKAHPQGFPRYRNRELALSAVLNSWMENCELQPTPKHKPYSARHSFEDMMKSANIDAELRRIIMGHSINRPVYGAGGTLEWRAGEMARIALDYDPAIITLKPVRAPKGA